MKFTSILITTLLLLGFNLSAQKATTKAEKDAANLIRFSNAIIDLGNHHSTTLDGYDNIAESIESNYKRVSRNPNAQPTYIGCKSLIQVNDGYQQQCATVTKATLPFAEKKEMEALVQKSLSDLALINVSCEKMADYFSNKEYATDNESAKFESLLKSYTESVETAKKSFRASSKYAAEMGDKAEMVLLKGSKIASFVIPMKTELNGMKAIMGDLFIEKPDLEAIALQVQKLDESIKQNEDISKKDVTKLSDVYYKDPYAGFYRSCSSFVKTINTIVQRLGANDTEGLNSWASSLQGSYSTAIEKYNSFISQ